MRSTWIVLAIASRAAGQEPAPETGFAFVRHATEAVISVLASCEKHREGDWHPTPDLVRQMMLEADNFAPIASSWCGWHLPAWLAPASMLKEGGGHNLRCEGSAGFFGFRPATYYKFSKRLELPVPEEGMFESPGLFRLGVCEYMRDHPIYSVRAYFGLMAFYAQRQGGALQRMLTT